MDEGRRGYSEIENQARRQFEVKKRKERKATLMIAGEGDGDVAHSGKRPNSNC